MAPYFPLTSYRGLRLRGRQGRRALLPGKRRHLRYQEERRRLVGGRHERGHGTLPGQLRRTVHVKKKKMSVEESDILSNGEQKSVFLLDESCTALGLRSTVLSADAIVYCSLH